MSDLFIKNNPLPIYVYDKESLRFLDANDAALKLYGFSLDEFIQMDITDLYSSEDIQSVLEFSQEIFKDGEFSKPFKHRKKDGNYIFVRISRIEYKYQESDAYINILENVSTLFETQKSNQIFKAAFENTNDMIFITDPEGVITFLNESVNKYLGFSSAELVNSDLTLNCSEEDKQFIMDSVFHSPIKETVTFTIELVTAKGRLLECEIVSTPIYDSNNKLESFILLAKPIDVPDSYQNKSVREFKEKRANKNVSTSDATEKSENVLTGSFLSELFHEILTPMNVILGFTQELVESLESPSPEQKEAMDIINQNRVFILSLMNTIAEFSDIQFNKAEAEQSEVQVTEIINVYEKSLNEVTGIRDLEFAYGRISSSIRFKIDRKKFFSLLNNLFRLVSCITSQKKIYLSAYQVENEKFNISISDGFGKSTSNVVETLSALIIENKDPKTFGLSKLTIEIITKLLETLKGDCVILNENTNKQDIGFVFPINFEQKEKEIEKPKKFSPTQPETKKEKQFVENESQLLQMNDEIEIVEENFSSLKNENELNVSTEEESQKGKIEEFKAEPEKLFISNKKNETEEKPTPTKNKNGLSSLRCLYIEDQVDSQILFKVQMKDLKSIQFATSFEEALPMLETHEFDFIIMDINLQGEYNGLDALKVIHQIPNLHKIPVIAVTAYVLPGDKEKFISTGFIDFIPKPIFRDK